MFEIETLEARLVENLNKLEVNGENEMIFTAGALTNEPSAPMVININESDSFKKSMWPYM